MDNDVSLEELRELRDRGLSPKASKEFLESFNNLLRFVYSMHEQTADVAQIMQRGGLNTKGATLYNQLSNELENLFVRGKQLDLEHSYDMDSLVAFRDLYHNFVNNDLLAYYTQLESVGALTDNVTENMKLLYNADDEFYRNIDKEYDKAQEKLRALDEVESVQTNVSPDFDKKQVSEEDVNESEQQTEKDDNNTQKLKEQERQMTAQDVVQSQADDKRKLPEDQVAQDKVADKHGLKKENPQQSEQVKSHEEAIAALQRIDKMFNRQRSNESFKNMMFGLKELREKKLLPDEYFDTYRAILNEVKEHRNTETGIFKLSSEINWQIQEMRDADKDALDKAKIGKQKKSQMSPVEKGNRFKEGIVNVLNKSRDEKSQNRIHDDKEKQDAFVQMLRRKKFKGVAE